MAGPTTERSNKYVKQPHWGVGSAPVRFWTLTRSLYVVSILVPFWDPPTRNFRICWRATRRPRTADPTASFGPVLHKYTKRMVSVRLGTAVRECLCRHRSMST